MQLAFQCPHCRQAVAVTPAPTRQKMGCPLCRGEFWVDPAPAGPAANGPPAPAGAPTNGPPGGMGSSPLPPADPNRPAVEVAAPPVIAPRLAAAAKVAAPPVAAAPPKPAAPVRAAARFIAAQAVDSTVKLTADGKLPELSLSEVESAKKDKGARSSNPLVLAAAVGASLLSSLLLLFVDVEPSATGGDRIREARQKIERYYANESDHLQPYQAYLRESQRAFSRGDQQTERLYYRRVLGLLRSESKSRYSGVTGTPSGDADLEKLLSTLLAD